MEAEGAVAAVVVVVVMAWSVLQRGYTMRRGIVRPCKQSGQQSLNSRLANALRHIYRCIKALDWAARPNKLIGRIYFRRP
jgi:hypothetical protein